MNPNEIQARINEIKKRLAEYFEHLNDPYAFDIDEIDQIRNFKLLAPEDINFLLQLKCPEITIRIESESESATSHKPDRVLIYNNDELLAEIVAELKLQPVADGAYCNCTILKQVIKDKGKKDNDV